MIRSADGLDSAVADSEMAARWPLSKRFAKFRPFTR
jgi:hypothetical protein